MDPIRIFIGYDPKEAIAFHVLSHSIIARATRPVAIQGIVRSQLAKLYTRERGPTESTEFSITRFLTPYLSEYRGLSIFMDCDMLCLTDIAKLYDQVDAERDGRTAIWVCQHDYVPKSNKKFLGQVQTKYPRKNWSSLMVFENHRCTRLTPSYVNTASGLDLHRFHWTSDEYIAKLDLKWNWLVGEYASEGINPYILHYTLGGPWFDDYRDTEFGEVWREELKAMIGQSCRI